MYVWDEEHRRILSSLIESHQKFSGMHVTDRLRNSHFPWNFPRLAASLAIYWFAAHLVQAWKQDPNWSLRCLGETALSAGVLGGECCLYQVEHKMDPSVGLRLWLVLWVPVWVRVQPSVSLQDRNPRGNCIPTWEYFEILRSRLLWNNRELAHINRWMTWKFPLRFRANWLYYPESEEFWTHLIDTWNDLNGGKPDTIW